MTAYSQKLIIVCPPHLQAKYQVIADLFTPDGNLQLIVPNNLSSSRGNEYQVLKCQTGVGCMEGGLELGF